MTDRRESVLVTGGAGFIGSHVVAELFQSGIRPIILDNFCNSSPNTIEALTQLCGQAPTVHVGDVCDRSILCNIFETFEIDAVIHLAGHKSVSGSFKKPLEYYRANVLGTLALLDAMQNFGCRKLVFSSSATVYGERGEPPYTEESPTDPTNPYGNTKLLAEQLIRDFARSRLDFSATNLRYFNPVGCHPSGLIGENPKGDPENLFPLVSQTAIGHREQLKIFGSDFATVDGTGVRDYVHVVDLAKGHLSALHYLAANTGCQTINLGTGSGHSVLQVLNTFSLVVGDKIPYEFLERRPGDVATSFADTRKAKELLNWSAKYNLEDMCRDLWTWQSRTPGHVGAK